MTKVEYAGRACGSVDAYHSLATQLCPAGRLSRVVGGGLHADSSGSRCSFVAYLDDPAAEYLVIPYSLGGPPTAVGHTLAFSDCWCFLRASSTALLQFAQAARVMHMSV